MIQFEGNHAINCDRDQPWSFANSLAATAAGYNHP
jgi:hypothetical protein